MKGSPSWPEGVPGIWKIELLRWLGQVTGIKTLIETGTCEGITSWYLRNDFDSIFTIELHAGLFESANKRLSGHSHIHQYFGSSRELLSKMIADAGTDRILFWLDAHSSGPHTADDGDALPSEIKTITTLCPRALIVVDDMHGLDKFMGQVGSAFPAFGWHCEYRTGEIIIYREGCYNIPEFE